MIDYKLVHATVGRFRFRVDRLLRDREYASKLIALVQAMQFVSEVRINPAAAALVVHYQPTVPPDLAQSECVQCILRAAGLNLSTEPVHFVTPEVDAETQSDWEAEVESPLQPEPEWQRLGLPLFGLSLALLAAPLELPPLLVGAAIFGAALPWFGRATDHLATQRSPSVDLLDSLWIGLHTLNGQFVAPALKTTLVGARAELRDQTTSLRQQEEQALVPVGTGLWVERQGKIQRLALLQVQPGDRFFVKAGETVPVDGQILAGTAVVNQQGLTGDPTPLPRTAGQPIYAATQIVSGQLQICVGRTGENTRVALAARLREQEPVYDTQIAHFQSEFARTAVVPTLLLATTIFAFTGVYSAAIAPFQLDFGSGIQLSLRTVLLSALTQSVLQGIYIRSAGALEALAQVDTIVLDQPPDTPLTATAIASLRSIGLDMHVLTPVSAVERQRLSQQWGLALDQIHTEVSAAAKVAIVTLLHNRQRQVAFWGMGIEDFPAFTQATLSLTCAGGGNVSHKAADVVLLEEDLRGLAQAILLCRKALQVVYQNAALIVIPNLVVVAGAVFWGLNPVVNVVTNNTTAFIAEFLNGSRPIVPPSRPEFPHSLTSPVPILSLPPDNFSETEPPVQPALVL
uniref:E1-E2 ATPase-associated domain protein n=1 Tax=Cyanothece sp. (strain PCC 7425 / ATCC 29141) TaxID=395961 RepID=B8HLY0_CYAP4